MKSVSARGRLAMLLLAATVVTGCVGPRVVTSITGRDDQAKFIYIQQRSFSTEQGIVQCKVGQQGDLSDCGKKPIIFEE